jgi:hypothetical protein
MWLPVLPEAIQQLDPLAVMRDVSTCLGVAWPKKHEMHY